MSRSAVAHSEIRKVGESGMVQTSDLLAVEEPLEIRIGYGPADNRQQKRVAVTMRTPGNDFELVAGFLFTEGIISDPASVSQIRYCTEANTLEQSENIIRVELKADQVIDLDKLQRNFYTTSSCGVCGKASIDAIRTICEVHAPADLRIRKDIIHALPDQLRAKQLVFEHTGGLHASALFDPEGNYLLSREDVGRHNALDKLIGCVFSGGSLKLPLNNHLLLLSGRASFELIQKAAMAGIAIICAVGAPSSLAVQTAQEFNMTLIGFLRENRFNIYTGAERILI